MNPSATTVGTNGCEKKKAHQFFTLFLYHTKSPKILLVEGKKIREPKQFYLFEKKKKG